MSENKDLCQRGLACSPQSFGSPAICALRELWSEQFGSGSCG